MTRYLLFAGDNYYPAGGASDYVGTFDTVEAAQEAWVANGSQWAQIAELLPDGTLRELMWAELAERVWKWAENNRPITTPQPQG